MRLVDGFSPSEGRVETCWNNTWIVACDSSWDDMDASVVCRQLGFQVEGKKKAVMSPWLGAGKVYCSIGQV